MKTSTLCTACGALMLLAAGLAGIVNPNPAVGESRWSSPLAGVSDALAAWMTPAVEPLRVEALRLPSPPREVRVYGAGVNRVRTVLVDAPSLDAETLDGLIALPGAPLLRGAAPADAEIKGVLERIESECRKARETLPATPRHSRRPNALHRA